MPSPKRMIAQRGAVAVASTALVVGSSVLAYPAFATEAPSDAPATPSASDVAVDTTGLAEAIKRDLKKSPEKYLEESEANVLAGDLKKALAKASIEANVVIEDGVVVVQVSDANLEKASKVIEAAQEKSSDVEASAEATDAAEDPLKTESAEPKASASESQKATTEKPQTAEAPKKTEEAATATPSESMEETPAAPEEPKDEKVRLEPGDLGKYSDPVKTLKALQKHVDPAQLKRLTSVTETASGKIRIRASGPAEVETSKRARSLAPDEASVTLEDFADGAGNVELVAGGDQAAANPAALEDIYGGMGYAITDDGNFNGSVGVCSVGFNAWDPSGNDAIITAGHCTNDGTTLQTAVAEHGAPGEFQGVSALLGTFGFNQFGLPNNEGYSPYDPNWENWDAGTDIAVIDGINKDLNLHAGVSKWPAGKDERDSWLKITSYGEAAIGAEACSVGRTTGWTCSKITEVGIFFVGGFKSDTRTVYGYTAPNADFSVLNQGDSGGAVVVGNRAVGINSANHPGTDGVKGTGDELAMYTSLVDARKKTAVKNYEVKLFVNAPKVTSPQNGSEIDTGSTITGTVANPGPNATVEVLVDGKVVDTVDVNGGKFSFKAPQTEGQFTFELRAKSGKFNESELTAGNYTLVAPEETEEPTEEPTEQPTEEPTEQPTEDPSESPTEDPSESPSESNDPSESPTESQSPTEDSSDDPSQEPTKSESPKQTEKPKEDPLADTGSSATPLLAVAGALGLCGALLLILRRSNRRHG